MKKLFTLSVCFVFLLLTNGCEKDDICDQATTPNLVVTFYKQGTTTTLNVTNLLVKVSGYDDLTFNGVSNISIPLKTSMDSTVLEMNLNGSDEDTTNDNSDIVTLNYTRKQVYVSRGCGYKTLFYLNDTNPYQLQTDTNNWIKTITVAQPTIENENETHLYIYF